MFSLVRALPSPASAEEASLFVRLVHRYYGAVRLLRDVRVRLVVFAFADRSRSWLVRDVLEVSRFSCMLFLGVRGFFDYAWPTDHSRLA